MRNAFILCWTRTMFSWALVICIVMTILNLLCPEQIWALGCQTSACSFGWWLMAGADLFWEKSTTSWLLVAGLFWEKSTAGWWLISRTNSLLSVYPSHTVVIHTLTSPQGPARRIQRSNFSSLRFTTVAKGGLQGASSLLAVSYWIVIQQVSFLSCYCSWSTASL
jgi:hypothetical protein